MSLKTVQKVIWALAAVFLLFVLLAYASESTLFFVFASLSVVGLVSFNLCFWRCPHCGQHLGRDVRRYCTHCGGELEL